MYHFHKVKYVSPLPELKLLVQFAQGVTKIYDMRDVINEIPVFEIFRTDTELFNSVYVDTGGYAVIWNDDLDLACDELWYNGVQITTSFDNLISFGDATELWELNESTLRKAISYGKLVPGIDVCKFGKQWVISMEAMRREYGDAKKNL